MIREKNEFCKGMSTTLLYLGFYVLELYKDPHSEWVNLNRPEMTAIEKNGFIVVLNYDDGKILINDKEIGNLPKSLEEARTYIQVILKELEEEDGVGN